MPAIAEGDQDGLGHVAKGVIRFLGQGFDAADLFAEIALCLTLEQLPFSLFVAQFEFSFSFFVASFAFLFSLFFAKFEFPFLLKDEQAELAHQGEVEMGVHACLRRARRVGPTAFFFKLIELFL